MKQSKIKMVKKRDGRVVPFHQEKIADAIFMAARSVGGENRFLAEELAGVVTMFLEKKGDAYIPEIEEIQDMVEKVLIETGHAKTAKAYILYREKRAQVRHNLQVCKRVSTNGDSTDLSLLVAPDTKEEIYSWNKSRIAEALQKESGLSAEISNEVACSVEKKVFAANMKKISTGLIRELVDNELLERGFSTTLKKQATIGMPKYDLNMLVFSKSKENSNIAVNNPEAINLAIAENTMKQYALSEVFSEEIADAHREGMVYIHDLGYPTRVYCSSHSLEYLKLYGLNLTNLDTSSAPAKHARTLTGHLNTFLASMQTYYAGALGVGYINIMYAPYLEGMDYDEMKQEAQHLIFSSSQNAFSRGGQTLFLDFNIHTGIPRYLADIPAVGPSGKYTGKTYGEYAETAQMFTRAMLDVWREGDRNGQLFAFPKCDFHITEESFTDEKQYELLQYACQIASENGTPYFVFDRDEVTLSACCRLRTTINDDYMIKHPESMRFCGFQNITINLPQLAYRSGKGKIEELYKHIDKAMEIAMEAHLQKKSFISKLMGKPGLPLWEIGRPSADGRPYVDLEKSTYIIGLIGLNECVEFMTDRELHEDDKVLRLGLEIVSYMNLKCREMGGRHKLRVALEESPAESATRRLAKMDLQHYPEARALVRGDIERDEAYYTNSIHLRASADVDMITRIRKQAMFHSLIESGAIIHAFVGEHRPPAKSIENLVRKTLKETQAAQLTISPEFTICKDCFQRTPGLHKPCNTCGSENTYGITRIVGYFSRVENWNKSKLGELKDRHQGQYSVPSAKPAPKQDAVVTA